MADVIFNSFKVLSAEGEIDLEDDTVKCMLVTSSYTPDKDAHDYVDDVTNEVVGTGYTAGGATLASKVVSQDDANDLAKFDAADVTWGSATITARAAVLYKDTGTPATSPLIVYIDFTEDKTSTADDFKIQWHANGIMALGE